MIVIWRNGKRTVITGWRAWLILLPVMSLAALSAVIIAFLVLGFALTIATLLIFALPLALILSILVSQAGPARRQ